MKLPSALRSALVRLALLLACGLCPALAAAALNETYEGMLMPDGFETPIPISVELREVSGLLLGRVTTGAPLSGSAVISSGENEFGKCTVRVTLPSGVALRLAGTCLENVYEGRYTVLGKGRDNRPQGGFRLMRKDVAKAQDEERRNKAPVAPLHTLTECISSNTRCLLSCPRGDYNVEFLCSNRCRQKFQRCKGQTVVAPAAPARAVESPAEAQR